MGIQDYKAELERLSDGMLTCNWVTMKYLEGGKRQLFVFRISRKDRGATTGIEVESPATEPLTETVQRAFALVPASFMEKVEP